MGLFELCKAHAEHYWRFGQEQTPEWPYTPDVSEDRLQAFTAAYRGAIERGQPVTMQELATEKDWGAAWVWAARVRARQGDRDPPHRELPTIRRERSR
jgi:hypothetical protein